MNRFKQTTLFSLVSMALMVGTVPVTPAAAETAVERGDYLVNTIGTCANCHTPKGGPLAGKPYAGGFEIGGPEIPFTAYAANITQDKETGIGTWTEEQIVTAIREGKRPDGTTIGPPMPIPMYRGLSDTDVKAIAAYLKTIQPVKNKVKKSVYRFPLPDAYGPPVGTVADIPTSDKVKYGEYLAGPVGHCVECHTPMVEGRHDFENQFARGGQEFHGPWGVSVSRNITPHMTDGIGSWSDAEIKRAVTKGISKDGTQLNPPMGFPYYANMKDSDLDAIIAYLRTLKPLADQ